MDKQTLEKEKFSLWLEQSEIRKLPLQNVKKTIHSWYFCRIQSVSLRNVPNTR